MSEEGVFAPGDALRKAEILYVDSDLHRRDAMRRVLLGLGAARVQIAESGSEALKVVAGTPCNLVIAEHRMTPMDGIRLVREIRSVTNYPRALVPALIIGDPVKTEVVAAAFQAGANLFLVRPLSAATLYERIGWAIADSRPFAVKDGHYVIRPAKPKVQARSTVAATKSTR
jgi:PleD family two-component response regulator